MAKKLFFIILSVLIMITVVVYMAVSNYNANFKSFEKAGYIIDSRNASSGNKKSTIYYFSEEEKYRGRYDDNIVFSDVNGEKVDVSPASFIHYNDDSIGALKKSVIFNLEEINNEIPKYYNIFDNTILQYKQGTYTVNNLGKTLKFKKFIVKVNDTKYLIVSDELKLKLDNEREISVKSNYIELNFTDEKVVTLENKDAIYQTIGKDASIELGNDITLNLDNRYLYAKDEAKLSIDQMIIDSSDNIEIQPIEEKEAEETTEEEENENNNGGSSGTGAESGDEDDGVAGESISGGIVENELNEVELSLPTADISELEVTANKIEGTIKITDKDSLITGGVSTTIVENSTGRVIDLIETDEGNYNIEVASSRLTPDTVYNLTSTLNYKKNDIVYTTDIVQHVFVTSSLGISLEKDYYTSSSLNYILKFDDFSKVKSCTASLYDVNGSVIDSYSIEKNENLEVPIAFTGLEANKKYSVHIDNILYDDYVVSDDYAIEQSAKTLKNRPDIGTPSFILDKKNGKFTLKLDNMVDSENGVESYRYQIYDTRTMDAGNGSPVNIVEKSTLTSIDVNVDNAIFYRGVGYVFNVAIEFYDNEKYVEYITPFSGVMQLDGREAPSISWKTNKVTFESIDGTISILDTGSTIDLDKSMTIVYTNSIGTTSQYTTSGNTIIPFTRNNLRANETYTISVYGTVNLQDGNPPIDNYHIGSASVKTNSTNPFNVSFDIDTDNVANTFSVTTRLLNNGNADNRLEASTLTGISFVLHEGLTVDGKVVKTVPARDRDLREYFSDLQAAYYDQTFVINPSFFGLSNSDLKEEYYTIELKDAYDYTDFKNEIGINNNVVTVKSNGYIPDIPKDPDDAVTFELIRNKDAETLDENLNAKTIVGIKYKANYDNARRYAKQIKYRVYDADDCYDDSLTGQTVCKEITSAAVDYEVGNDGNIDYVSLPVGYGTIYNEIDNEVRRGHNYYVTYEAYLDLNGDGEAETKYPAQNDITLKSKTISVPKQAATITMYPSSTTSDSMKIKYQYSDADLALYGKKLYAAIEQNSIGDDAYIEHTVSSSLIELTSNEKLANFTGLTPGMLTIYAKQIIYKKPNFVETDNSFFNFYTYIKQKFYSEYTLPSYTYYLSTDVNRLIINFNNYTAHIDDYNRIAGINLKFKGTVNGRQKIIEKKGIRIEDGAAIVDLFDLVEFMGQDIQVSVDALYDTELIGYDLIADYYALQNIENEYGGGEYYRVASNGSILYDLYVPTSSIFTKEKINNNYVFTNIISEKNMKIPHSPDEGGMVYNYNHIIPKKIASKTLQPATSESNSFSFKKVVPGVSLLDKMGISKIVPMMTSTTISASLFGFESGVIDVRDNKAYINIYKTDETGTEMEEVSRTEININDLTNGVTVDGLFPDTSYAMTITAFVNDGDGNYEEQRLYDVDDNTPSKTYYFNTLSGVNFDSFYYYYTATSYNQKKLSFHYSMDRTMGFDEIEYHFYKRVYNALTGEYSYEEMEDINIPNTTALQNNMSLKIDVNPGQTSFVFGNNYRLEVIPIVYVTIDGVRTPVKLSNDGGVYDFNLRSLKKPYIGVKGVYTSDYTGNQNVITFITNVYDSSRVVVDDKYTVQLLDENNNDITPEAYVGYQASTKRYNTEYLAPALEVGHVYRFIVKYSVDMKNNITSTEEREYVYEINLLSSDDINVGNINATANAIYPNRIDLQFYNSYRLTLIDTLSYSIYNSADGSSIDGSIAFAPEERTISGEKLYIQPLPDTLPTAGLYFVQTQFLSDGRVIYDGGVDYTYVK